MTDAALEDGLTELDELSWDLGGFVLPTTGDLGVGVAYDDGLDHGAEVAGDDHDGAGDGVVMSRQTLHSRAITLGLSVATGPDSEEFQQVLDLLAGVVNPLPDRYNGVRLLRWRRKGAVAKRVWYRPAQGRVMTVSNEEARLLYNNADIVIRLEAPDPIIYSDALHQQTYGGSASHTIANAGTFTAIAPSVWELDASGTVTISHDDYSGESITFPSTGALTVRQVKGGRDVAITAPGTYGVCYGPGGQPFPRYPLLRPGDNSIHASAACTFRWRDTWL